MAEAQWVPQISFHIILAFADSFHVKRAEPKGAFEHRAIKEVLIKTIFTASKGLDCLADAFEDGDTHLFNPVPSETIALAATAVLFLGCVISSVADASFTRSSVLSRNGDMGCTRLSDSKVRFTNISTSAVSNTWQL